MTTTFDQVTTTAQDQAGKIAGRAKNVISDQLDQRSTDLGNAVGTHVDNLRTIAQTLRDQNQNSTANLAEMAAERLSGVGDYLRTTDGDRLIADMESLVRRQPLVGVGAGILLGLAASRMLKASAADRYSRYSDDYAQSYGDANRYASSQTSMSYYED